MKNLLQEVKKQILIYKVKCINIMELARKFKGKYSLDFDNKGRTKVQCKISIIVKLPCKFMDNLNLVDCYGFGKEPLLLLTNLNSTGNRLPVVVTKIYLMRCLIEEYFRLKNNSLLLKI